MIPAPVPTTSPPADAPIDALLDRRLASSRGRRFLGAVTAAILCLLALSMLVLRIADGPKAFFPGILARGMGTYLLLVAMPFGFALARLGKSYPVDLGLLVLFRMRGVDPRKVETRLRVTAVRLAALRGLAVGGALGSLSLVLSLPDTDALKRALPAVLGVLVVGVGSSVGLALAGFLAAQWARARGSLLLFLAFLVPLFLSTGLPDGYVGDLFGLYDAAIDEALRLGRLGVFERCLGAIVGVRAARTIVRASAFGQRDVGQREQGLTGLAGEVEARPFDQEEAARLLLAALHLETDEGTGRERAPPRLARRLRCVGKHDQPVVLEREQLGGAAVVPGHIRAHLLTRPFGLAPSRPWPRGRALCL